MLLPTRRTLWFAGWLTLGSCILAQDAPKPGKSPAKGRKDAGHAQAPSAPAAVDKDKGKEQTAYNFGLPTQDGKNLPLAEFRGKVLLIVNVARQSSYNSQLQQLEKLSEAFRDKGLIVLAVPSNDFGNAEPGQPAEVSKFYADAKLTFPVMQVSTLTGVHELPLFTFLSHNKAIPDDGLHWNYTKFLVDRTGKPVVCFPPEVSPDSLDMQAIVQEVLDGTWKPKKPAHDHTEQADDDDDDGM